MKKNSSHISKKVRDKLQSLVDKGLYDNQSEIFREAIRNHMLKYKAEMEKNNGKR